MLQVATTLPMDIKYINVVSTKDTNAVIKVITNEESLINLSNAMKIIDALNYKVKFQFNQDTLTIISDLPITRIDKILYPLVITTIELSSTTYVISQELTNKIKTALSSSYFKESIS